MVIKCILLFAQVLVMGLGVYGVWASFDATRKLFGQITGLQQITPDPPNKVVKTGMTNDQLFDHVEARIYEVYKNLIGRLNQVIAHADKVVDNKNRNELNGILMRQIRNGQYCQILSYILTFIIVIIAFIIEK